MAPALWGIPVVQSSTDRTVQFPIPLVYQRVHNLQTGNIELWDGTQWKSAIPVTLNVGSLGAVGDGLTDNAAAFAALSAQVNAVAVGTPVTVQFPDGVYNYTSGLVFTREVTLTGTGTLNYLGTGIAIKMGADNFNVANEATNRHFIVDGLGFIGGATMTSGIYFNTLVTQPRVLNCKFYKFGNANAWGIFGQSDNWDMLVDRCSWVTDSTSDTTTRNWIRANGVRTDGTTDLGQTRLRVYHCLATEQSHGAGVCIWVNGVTSEIAHNKIEGFAVNVHIGPTFTSWVRVVDNYFETTKGTECIRYGDPLGVDTSFGFNMLIRGNYCNVHNTDSYATTASFIGNASAVTGLQNCRVRDNFVTGLTPGRELIRQPNNPVGSQVGNVASGNTGHTVLHTAGNNIARWNGEDEDFSPVGLNSDGPGVKFQRLHGGFTINAGATITVTFTWTTPFPDGEYTPIVSLYDDNNNDPSAPGAAINLTWTFLSPWTGSVVSLSIHNPTGSNMKAGASILAIYGG